MPIVLKVRVVPKVPVVRERQARVAPAPGAEGARVAEVVLLQGRSNSRSR